MLTTIGTTLYQGIKRDISVDPDQARPLRFSRRDGFVVNSRLSTDFTALQDALNDYCRDQIKSIIDSSIRSLRHKKVTLTLPYTDGTRTFDKQVTMSVDDYLDATGFSRQLKYEIGAFEREWGINAIDPKMKIFTLYFNLNLIKYDDGPHIRHVVAHELAHIFVRDHSTQFQDVLSQLDSSSRWSQTFFNSKISNVGTTQNIIPLVVALIIITVCYWLYAFISSDTSVFLTIFNLFGIQSPTQF